MTPEPKVSVVIGTYNRRYCLKRTLDSVLSQTYPDVELIVVDDASTDGTSEWIHQCYPSIKLITFSANAGVATARNAGFKISTGELIVFLDSDDWWKPEFLALQARHLLGHPGAVLTYCDHTLVKSDGRPIKVPPTITPIVDPIRLLLFHNPIITPSTVMFSRDALLKAGLFRQDMINSEDLELYLRVCRLGSIIHLPLDLAFKTVSKDSKSRDFLGWARYTTKILDEFFAREGNEAYLPLENSARAHRRAVIALTSLREGGRPSITARLAMDAFRYDPYYTLRYLAYRARRILRRW